MSSSSAEQVPRLQLQSQPLQSTNALEFRRTLNAFCRTQKDTLRLYTTTNLLLLDEPSFRAVMLDLMRPGAKTFNPLLRRCIQASDSLKAKAKVLEAQLKAEHLAMGLAPVPVQVPSQAPEPGPGHSALYEALLARGQSMTVAELNAWLLTPEARHVYGAPSQASRLTDELIAFGSDGLGQSMDATRLILDRIRSDAPDALLDIDSDSSPPSSEPVTPAPHQSNRPHEDPPLVWHGLPRPHPIGGFTSTQTPALDHNEELLPLPAEYCATPVRGSQ
jgi:hypothetical protein